MGESTVKPPHRISQKLHHHALTPQLGCADVVQETLKDWLYIFVDLYFDECIIVPSFVALIWR